MVRGIYIMCAEADVLLGVCAGQFSFGELLLCAAGEGLLLTRLLMPLGSALHVIVLLRASYFPKSLTVI